MAPRALCPQVNFYKASATQSLLSHIQIGDDEFKAIQRFTYLGYIISSDAKIDRKIQNRLSKAYSVFGSLTKRVWTNKHLKKATKDSMHRAIVMNSLLYGRVVGHQLKPPVIPRALPPALSAHHSQHPLE